MWVILINGKDSGFSIMGSSYEDALVAAIDFVGSTPQLWTPSDDDDVDVAHWENAL